VGPAFEYRVEQHQSLDIVALCRGEHGKGCAEANAAQHQARDAGEGLQLVCRETDGTAPRRPQFLAVGEVARVGRAGIVAPQRAVACRCKPVGKDTHRGVGDLRFHERGGTHEDGHVLRRRARVLVEPSGAPGEGDRHHHGTSGVRPPDEPSLGRCAKGKEQCATFNLLAKNVEI
jgi:hypothetical protein